MTLLNDHKMGFMSLEHIFIPTLENTREHTCLTEAAGVGTQAAEIFWVSHPALEFSESAIQHSTYHPTRVLWQSLIQHLPHYSTSLICTSLDGTFHGLCCPSICSHICLSIYQLCMQQVKNTFSALFNFWTQGVFVHIYGHYWKLTAH